MTHQYIGPHADKKKKDTNKNNEVTIIDSKEEERELRRVGFIVDHVPMRKATKEDLADESLKPHIIASTAAKQPTARPRTHDALTDAHIS
jgi:hypothetical protein